MKHTKRALACLLFLALLASFSAFFAFADETATSPINWDDFYIISQTEELHVKQGESFTLSVKVNIPAGIDRVTYQWVQTYSTRLEGATMDTLQLNPGDTGYPYSSFFDYDNTSYAPGPGGSHRASYYCEITAYSEDSAAEPKTISRNYATVMVEGSSGRKLFSLTLEPFVHAFKICAEMFYLYGPFGFIYYPVMLIRRYSDSFKAVRS